MKIVRDSPFALAATVFQLRPPQPSLCVTIKATFAFAAGARECTIAPEQALPAGDVYYDEDVTRSLRFASDFVPIKARAECYLVGSCHPPGGRATQSAVSFRVGSVSRTVAVFGNRYWRGAIGGSEATAPEPFESMPLQFERCFGGSGFAANPVGMGLGPSSPSDPRVPLPNLEDPSAQIESRGDRPSPASLFPVPPAWHARTALLGTYDATWTRTRWPWFAADLDIAYFNACPPALQIEGGWRGDEKIELQNVVPGQPVVSVRLPGLRPRCMIEPKGPGSPALREVPTTLDTIVVDAERSLVFCTWRGTVDVRSEAVEEIERLFVCHEPLQRPGSPGELRERFDRAVAAMESEKRASEPEAIPVAPPVSPPAVASAMPKVPVRDADDEETDRLLEQHAPPAVDPDATPSPPNLDAMLAFAASAKAKGLDFADDLLSLLREGAHPAEPEAAPATPQPPGPASRARALEWYARNRSLAYADLTGVDLSDASFANCNFTKAILNGTRFRNCDLRGAVFDRAVLTRADFTAAQMAGASLKGADLTHAVLVRADLTDAVLDESVLANVDASDARLPRSSLIEVEAPDATFAGADLRGATLNGADLTRANLSRARLTKASMVETEIGGADCTGVDMTDADLTRLRAGDRVRMTGAVLRGARADGSLWPEARLDRAVFAFASLLRADFSDASLVQADFSGCKLQSAQFRGAKLTGARMHRANCAEAIFESADLSHADLRGGNFHTAAFWRARVDGAQLETAIVTGTLLEGSRS